MRHVPVLLLALAAGGIALGSCTVDASVATDRAGRVVGVQAVRVASTLKQLTVAVAVDGGGPMLHFLWRQGVAAAAATEAN